MNLSPKDLESLVETLAAALADALPYVRGAYECAFPDESENRSVLTAGTEALALYELSK